MDQLCSHPSFPSSSSSSSTILIHRETAEPRFPVLYAVLRRLVYVTLSCFFALVGSLIGAAIGALKGQGKESGFFRGAAIGAVSGAIFSIEVFESFVVLWCSDESGGSLLYLTNIISSLLRGQLVTDLIGPAMLSAVQSQMNDARLPFEEVMDIFDTGGAKGLSRDSVEKLPKIKVTDTNNVDAFGERLCCSVCLQDFQGGETLRSLPHCSHMFHLPCIDNWLIRNGSCPLCRHNM